MAEGQIVFAGFAPHPPIMVPEVGHEAIAEVRSSIDAMREFTERVKESGAETVVLISPHAPLEPHAFVAYHADSLYGDFANFRAPQAVVEAQLDEELLASIARESLEQGYEVHALRGYDLDHGTTVPLYFLLRGWRGKVVALGYSFLSNEDHLSFGSCITRAVKAAGRTVAFIASGDLSHRLKLTAPAGYEPDAHLFDEEIVESLRAGEPERIIHVDQSLRKRAGECGYRSLLVALGVVRELEPAYEVMSYEAPFGVGYLVAQLSSARKKEMSRHKVAEENESSKASDELETEKALTEDLPALARRSIETFIREGKRIQAPTEIAPQPAACFVSIKTLEGDLRGCIGTIEPTKESLAEELVANAISAATRDPRFPPIAPAELSQLRYSVDVLAAPEPAQFADLDPANYGVIVEDEWGLHRGLLLPDIEGVETSEQQVAITMRKAGIAPGAPVKLYRFRVERFREQAHRKPQSS